MPTLQFWRSPASVMLPGGAASSSSAVALKSACLPLRTWLGPGISRLNTSIAIGTSPGCATQVPSCPSLASRSLSARTLASASSFRSLSSLIRIWAAMPPIAWAPRRWQVRITSRL